MAYRVTLQDRFRELEIYRARAWFALFFCAFFLLVLIGRLFYLQIVHHELFSTQSQNNRVRLKALPPPRGLIFDRYGRVLAENIPNFQLEITPEEVPDVTATLTALREIIELSDNDIERFKKELKQQRKFNDIPLRFNLNEEEVARFAVNRYKFPGVDVVARLARYYPYGAATVHALGYVGRIDEADLKNLDEANYSGTTHTGKLGIEKSYEAELHGKAGYTQIEINAEGRLLRELDTVVAQPGLDLMLTIDVDLQQIAQEALGEFNGAVVAIEPSTGAVRALVSRPGFDPQLFVNGISQVNYSALQNDDNNPLFDRALRGQYPPGSTVKPMYGFSGLESGHTTAQRSVFCQGFFRLGGVGRRYRDWKETGHGSVNYDEAVTQSCDIFFYDLANRMGITELSAWMARFGVGRVTGIDVPGEKSGILPSDEWKRKRFKDRWYAGETLSVGIGQGYLLMTPLQLAQMTVVLANRGVAYKPHFIHDMQDSLTGKSVYVYKPQQTLSIVAKNPKHWDMIQSAMVNVVHGERGTARAAGKDAEYKIAGKTGTAQVIGIGQNVKYDAKKINVKHRDHAWFIAFAPAEAPRLAIAVLVENGGHGGSAAAPIARKVFDRYFAPGPSESLEEESPDGT
ncbi:MAG: penicillin-binding protein 2 [Gammaproteobacteria bacterium]|nr:penicillin-binding protein 2 [Gammaproteobacteria bacterium]